MSLFTKEIISEKTIIIWLVASAASTILALLLSSIIVYLIYDCWPLTKYQVLDNICLIKLEPNYLKFIPILFGIIFGTILTFKLSD